MYCFGDVMEGKSPEMLFTPLAAEGETRKAMNDGAEEEPCWGPYIVPFNLYGKSNVFNATVNMGRERRERIH